MGYCKQYKMECFFATESENAPLPCFGTTEQCVEVRGVVKSNKKEPAEMKRNIITLLVEKHSGRPKLERFLEDGYEILKAIPMTVSTGASRTDHGPIFFILEKYENQ